jgi:hypothetical protein
MGGSIGVAQPAAPDTRWPPIPPGQAGFTARQLLVRPRARPFTPREAGAGVLRLWPMTKMGRRWLRPPWPRCKPKCTDACCAPASAAACSRRVRRRRWAAGHTAGASRSTPRSASRAPTGPGANACCATAPARRSPSNTYTNTTPNRTLQRALEHWQPSFLDWWRDMGPEESRTLDIYLRTAVGVDASGWAQFDYVKMPEYRWGICVDITEAVAGTAYALHSANSSGSTPSDFGMKIPMPNPSSFRMKTIS